MTLVGSKTLLQFSSTKTTKMFGYLFFIQSKLLCTIQQSIKPFSNMFEIQVVQVELGGNAP